MYLHNFGNNRFTDASQIHILEIQIDGNGTVAALQNINTIYV